MGAKPSAGHQYVERLCALGPGNRSQAYWSWLWDLLAPPHWGPQAPRCWLLEVAALSNQLQLESHLLCRMMSVMLQEEAFPIWTSLPTDRTNSETALWLWTYYIGLQERAKDCGESEHKPIVLFDRPTTLRRPGAAFRNSIRLYLLWCLPG